MNTLSKIRDIFYSGDFAFNGESESINEISFLLDEKYLFLDSVEIAKKLDYFRQGGIQEFIQVPYPSEDDNVLTGFVFTVGDQLIEFLNFLDETTRNKTKEVFRKRY